MRKRILFLLSAISLQSAIAQESAISDCEQIDKWGYEVMLQRQTFKSKELAIHLFEEKKGIEVNPVILKLFDQAYEAEFGEYVPEKKRTESVMSFGATMFVTFYSNFYCKKGEYDDLYRQYLESK